MLRLISTLFIVNFLFITSSIAASSKTKTSHLLWQVEGTQATIYLFGTIHVGEQSMYPFPEKIKSAIKASKNIVLEVDMNPKNELEMGQKMMQKAMYTDGSSLKDHLSSEIYQETISYVNEHMPMLAGQVNRMKPWFLSIAATMFEIQKAGFDANLGIEKYLQHTAKVQKKKIIALETIDFQLKLLSQLPSQEKFLKKTIEELPKTKELMTKVIKMWKEGDIKGLHKELVAPMKIEMPKVYKVMLTDRNINMVAGIEKLAKNKSSYFVAVGSAHYIGEDGIITLLRKKGYTVTKL